MSNKIKRTAITEKKPQPRNPKTTIQSQGLKMNENNNLIFRYDVEQHHIPIEIDKSTIETVENILNLIQKQSNQSLTYEIFTEAEKEGSFKKVIGISFLAVCMVNIIFKTSDFMDTGFFKGLTGTTGENIGMIIEENIKRFFTTNSVDVLEEFKEDAIIIKNKHCQKCYDNPHIDGISYSNTGDFISKVEIKKDHIIELPNSERKYYIYVQIDVTSPVYKQKSGGHGRVWQGRIIAPNPEKGTTETFITPKTSIDFYMQDPKFKKKLDANFSDKNYLANIQKLQVIILVEIKNTVQKYYVKKVVDKDEDLKDAFDIYIKQFGVEERPEHEIGKRNRNLFDNIPIQKTEQ